MTINEAARKLNVSAGRIRVLVRQNRIPGAKLITKGSDGNPVPVPFYSIPDDLKALPTNERAGTPPGVPRNFKRRGVVGAPPAPKGR